MNNSFWLIGFLVTLSLSCGASPRRGGYGGYGGASGGGGTAPIGGGAGTPTGGPAANLNNPLELLGAIDRNLSSQGYNRLGPAIHGNLQAGGLIAYAVQSDPGSCYTIVALGQPHQDVNLIVVDPAGRTIGHDVHPDAHPWTTVCPGVGGRMIARLQMVSGGGEYYYAAYQGPAQTRPDLASFFGGGTEARPENAQLDSATAGRLRELDQQLGSENFRRNGEPIGLLLDERQERNFTLNLQGGTCYAFASLGGAGARDTDIFLVDGSGNEIQKDIQNKLDGLIRFCPTQSGSFTLRSRLYTGRGGLFTVAYVQQGGSGTAAPSTPLVGTSSTGGGSLDENFRLLDGDMRARGYESFGDQARGRLNQGEARDFEIALEGGKCYAILAVGDAGVRDLDLRLFDQRGQAVDRDIESNSRPIVRVCPNNSGNFKMQVRMYSGVGDFVYGAYRWPRGTRGPFGLAGLMYVRLAEVTSLLTVEGYEPDVDYTPGKGRLASQGSTKTHKVRLEQGKCYSVLVVGGQGLNDIDLVLSSGATQLATDGTTNAFPSVRQCAQQTGDYELRIKATNGAGPYFYQVFRLTAGG